MVDLERIANIYLQKREAEMRRHTGFQPLECNRWLCERADELGCTLGALMTLLEPYLSNLKNKQLAS